ncbi:unnamed protein product [Albugo candida]|uniref:Uncharacterized protein n=1 Tax=Albugo candida TaxID=65357 RepID=A0A024GAR3_9STRA|nr:unnamed protein product [Albugo candida]|eukprot:CCI43645.1 unnamed protein product [Albugo candida]
MTNILEKYFTLSACNDSFPPTCLPHRISLHTCVICASAWNSLFARIVWRAILKSVSLSLQPPQLELVAPLFRPSCGVVEKKWTVSFEVVTASSILVFTGILWKRVTFTGCRTFKPLVEMVSPEMNSNDIDRTIFVSHHFLTRKRQGDFLSSHMSASWFLFQ